MSLRSLLTSGLVCFCAGGLYGWSALIAPMQAAYGVTTAQTGLIFSLAIVSFTVAVILVPRLPVKTSTPSAVACFGLFSALSVLAAARMPEFEFFLLWFSGGFGAASGGIYIAALGVAASAPAHKIATPAMVAAFGTGGAVFGPLWRVMDAAGYGLDGLLLLAGGLGGCSVLAAFTSKLGSPIRSTPRADRVTSARPAQSAQVLAMIWTIFAFGSFGGLMVLGLASKMMDVAGAGVALGSLGLAGIALGNTSGRLSVALLTQHLTPQTCMLMAMGLTLAGLAMAAFHLNPVMLCVALILVATGYGVVASTVPVMTRAAFGADDFAKRFSVVFSAWGVAGFLAPWAGGVMFDMRDSFMLPLLCAMGTALVCGWLSVRLPRRATLKGLSDP
ncbi:hypothetical protein [uncultured Roseobacter sp.]|uniref:hypothetical protein n=1 Tax=uncultured Roseobacter sp. TaxID=114847 RepID=UPI002606EF5F|nr:hypothetical protein [uncultured Roseobacter sp.]